ncbi:V4R domain-containing protein [Bacteroides sp. 51]|uniref:V4R domain-containing protein n=1 Tax=Bacteroides sp. 51 TaxID=2302938 RepID=UPI0013D1FFBC|nr:4-vinyl reductase [Bacteroides sp. 51]NDV80670.1 4-vinyl reductase [Bacteroides sp. 51]
MEEYNFSWNQLGDIAEGRPNLGNKTNVAVYRLMQYTMRAVLEKEYGDERTRELLVMAGRLAGREFCKNVLDTTLPLNKFIAQLDKALVDLSIGILRVEKSDPENLRFTVTVSEDLDCSGLPIKGVTVCDYDEGFIEGIFHVYTGRDFIVKEIDCWTTGERTCRFTINPR